MADGQGLGTLLFTTPLPRIPILEPCFPFSPLGTPTRFPFLAPLAPFVLSLCLFTNLRNYHASSNYPTTLSLRLLTWPTRLTYHTTNLSYLLRLQQTNY